MKTIKDSKGSYIQPFDVIKNVTTDVTAVVVSERVDGKSVLVAWNDVIDMAELLSDYPDGQWEVVGSFLTYWCTETLESKRLEVIKEELE